MSTDDRAAFAAERAAHRAELDQDARLRELDLAIVERSDQLGYSYVWDWAGLPVIQMPTDIVAMQELIWANRPQVVVETGVARGGSLVMLASLMLMTGEPGRVVGVDVDIRPHNRQAIESHPMASHISLVQGSSVDAGVLDEVRGHLDGAERVMVVLDSDHTHGHVLEELRAYSPLVSAGQSLVVADTVVEQLPVQQHRPRAWGPGNNPLTAVHEFLTENPAFELDAAVNAKLLMSSSRGGYLRRVR